MNVRLERYGYSFATANATLTNSGLIEGGVSVYLICQCCWHQRGCQLPCHDRQQPATIKAGGYTDGIDAHCTVLGDASCVVSVTNNGTIITYGSGQYGIDASSNVFAVVGNATAATFVSNGGNITTYGNNATAIFSGATAAAVQGNATASSTVSNSGNIKTFGRYAYGINAYAYARV